MKYKFILSIATVMMIAACGNNSGQKKSAPANEASIEETKSEVVEQTLPELEVGKQIDLPHNSGGNVEILFLKKGQYILNILRTKMATITIE